MASPVGAFIRDACSLGAENSVEVDVLYQHYRQWCIDNGRPPASRQIFGRDLRAARPEIRLRRHGQHEGRVRFYAGISVDSTAGFAGPPEFQSHESRGTDHCSADGDGDQFDPFKDPARRLGTA